MPARLRQGIYDDRERTDSTKSGVFTDAFLYIRAFRDRVTLFLLIKLCH